MSPKNSTHTSSPLVHAAHWGILILAIALFAYTQTVFLYDIPGPHFDEAWQGLFAKKIFETPSFWPLEAMNAYTTPLLHYFIAFVYKLSNPTFEVTRAMLSILQGITALLASLLVFRKTRSLQSMAFFLIIWSLLPISFFDRRFFVEVTVWHTFCAVIALWSLDLWSSHPRISRLLFCSTFLLALYSHIVFIAFGLGLLAATLHLNSAALKTRQTSFALRLSAALSMPLFIHVGVSTHKITAILIALAIAVILIFSFFENLFIRGLALGTKVLKTLNPITLIATFAFIIYHAGGLWPFAQHLGTFLSWPLILSSTSIILFLIFLLKEEIQKNSTLPIWKLFQWTVVFTMILTLKWSPRFFLVSALLFTLSLTVFWSQSSQKIKSLSLIVFTVLHLFIFNHEYVQKYRELGSQDSDVYFLLMKDSSRDFRPFQRAYHWIAEQGCSKTLTWYEDDRFILPIRYYTMGKEDLSSDTCPWKSNELFFSHILDYHPHNNESFKAPYPDLELLMHKKAWGDLAFWLRKKQN